MNTKLIRLLAIVALPAFAGTATTKVTTDAKPAPKHVLVAKAADPAKPAPEKAAKPEAKPAGEAKPAVETKPAEKASPTNDKKEMGKTEEVAGAADAGTVAPHKEIKKKATK